MTNSGLTKHYGVNLAEEKPVLGIRPEKGLFTPMLISICWLGGTYVLFLLVGQVLLVPNFSQLTAFVVASIAVFAIGYWLKAIQFRRRLRVTPQSKKQDPDNLKVIRRLVAISAAYFGAYGLAQLAEYGAGGPGAILSALQNPGAAYIAKFQVYASQQATGETNWVLQLLTLLAVLSTPLVPFLIAYWRRFTKPLRIWAAFGLLLYASFYLYIGTLSGLGDILIFAVVASLVSGQWSRGAHSRRPGRLRRLLVVAIIALFLGYMAFNQASRLITVGVSNRFKPAPIVAAVTTENFARGVSVVAFYPTHGYLGLGYNLETPFRWTKGRGASRALDGYWVQYIGGKSMQPDTYPWRTEGRTGWPADRYWSTVYPWLASDLSYPGVLAFMGVAGWWLARFWYEAAFLHKPLSLLLLCQIVLFIAYVPANNHIGISRTSMIALGCLLIAYGYRRLERLLIARAAGWPKTS